MADEDPNTMGAEAKDVYLWRRNDELGIVEYANGTTRPYTEEEIVAADERAAVEAERVRVIQEGAGLDADGIRAQQIVDLAPTLIDAAPSVFIRDLAAMNVRLIGMVKDLTRLL